VIFHVLGKISPFSIKIISFTLLHELPVFSFTTCALLIFLYICSSAYVCLFSRQPPSPQFWSLFLYTSLMPLFAHTYASFLLLEGSRGLNLGSGKMSTMLYLWLKFSFVLDRSSMIPFIEGGWLSNYQSSLTN
jgi:hypothetical protein